MGSLRAHRAPLASALLLASLCACGGEGAPPSASARVELGNVVIRAEIPAGKFGTLFLGAPRTQDRPPAPGTGSLGFEMDPMGNTSARAMATIDAAAPRPIETSIPFDAIPDGAYVFQWIVHDRAMSLMPIVAATPPIYVLHSGTSCETYGVASYVWRSHRNTLDRARGVRRALGIARLAPPVPAANLGNRGDSRGGGGGARFRWDEGARGARPGVGRRRRSHPRALHHAVVAARRRRRRARAGPRVPRPRARDPSQQKAREALYFHVYDAGLADVPGRARARATSAASSPRERSCSNTMTRGPGCRFTSGAPRTARSSRAASSGSWRASKRKPSERIVGIGILGVHRGGGGGLCRAGAPGPLAARGVVRPRRARGVPCSSPRSRTRSASTACRARSSRSTPTAPPRSVGFVGVSARARGARTAPRGLGNGPRGCILDIRPVGGGALRPRVRARRGVDLVSQDSRHPWERDTHPRGDRGRLAHPRARALSAGPRVARRPRRPGGDGRSQHSAGRLAPLPNDGIVGIGGWFLARRRFGLGLLAVVLCLSIPETAVQMGIGMADLPLAFALLVTVVGLAFARGADPNFSDRQAVRFGRLAAAIGAAGAASIKQEGAVIAGAVALYLIVGIVRGPRGDRWHWALCLAVIAALLPGGTSAPTAIPRCSPTPSSPRIRSSSAEEWHCSRRSSTTRCSTPCSSTPSAGRRPTRRSFRGSSRSV